MRTMRYKYINWANKRGRCSSHKALIKCEFRHSVDIKGAWKYLTRHLRTIKRERVRKINIYLCESSAFLRVAVFLHINCRACRGTQTFGSYKYLTPVCQCSHAENPKRQANRWTVSHWVSLLGGLNECAGSAEVHVAGASCIRQVERSTCSPAAQDQRARGNGKSLMHRTAARLPSSADYSAPFRSLQVIKTNPKTRCHRAGHQLL